MKIQGITSAVHGAPAITNGHYLFVFPKGAKRPKPDGVMPSGIAPSANNVEQVWDALARARDWQKLGRPIAGRGEHVEWVGLRFYMRRPYYTLATRLFPMARFEYSSNQQCFAVCQRLQQVGFIMAVMPYTVKR